MSDPTPGPSNEGGNTPSGPTPAAGDEFQPITSQAELDKRIGPRLERERARYADYPDLKAKAARVDEVEAAADQRVKEAEAALAGVPAKVAETLKSHMVKVHAISDEDAELFLTATDPETLLKQVERLTSRSGDAKKHNNVVPREGATSPNPGTDKKREFLRDLTGRD